MAARRSWGIRARVTAISVLGSLAAMVVVVCLAAYAASSGVRSMVEQSLVERLDAAEAFVVRGEFERAVDHTGVDLMQLIGPDGRVIAATPNAQGLAAIALEALRDEVEELDLELDDLDDEDDPEVQDSAEDSSSATTSSEGTAYSVDDDEDYDDDDYSYVDDDDDAAWSAQSQATDWEEDSWSEDDNDADYEYDDDDDYEDESDDDDSYEDEDDDDGTRAAGAIGFRRLSFFKAFCSALHRLLGPVKAYGTPASSVSASSVMGTPGPFLIMQRKVESPQGEVTMVAMTTLAPAVAIAKRTAAILGFALTLLLALVGAFSWIMTGRTLQPVEMIRREVESITAEGLDQRVSTPEGDPSLVRLVETFNRMLARIESALKEQRRFVSDASHELKSPIASTGLILEVLRACPEDLQSAEVLDDLETENNRLSRIVSDLLTLARSDEGRLAVSKMPTDLCDVLFEETALLRRKCTVIVDDSGVEPAIGLTDPTLLSHAIRNLLDNAACYAAGGIWVSCQEDAGGRAVIRVSDDGPGIPLEDRERVFGRFVRLDEAREGAMKGTGLGLSVTREIVESLGGEVAFVNPERGGTTAEVIIPLG